MYTTINAILDNNNKLMLRSPLVGIITHIENNLTYCNPHSNILEIQMLQKKYNIITPNNCIGSIKSIHIYKNMNIQFGQKILTLSNDNKTITTTSQNTYQIYNAPMDGVFYRKPSPTSNNFVKEGDIIQYNTTLGLIEVMKCFYKLKYEHQNNKRIYKILKQDATPINIGDKLFLFEEIK